jgi:hypothetical protein
MNIRKARWATKYCASCATYNVVFIIMYDDGTTSYTGRCADCEREAAPTTKYGPHVHRADALGRY